jgi:hypothetical protein
LYGWKDEGIAASKLSGRTWIQTVIMAGSDDGTGIALPAGRGNRKPILDTKTDRLSHGDFLNGETVWIFMSKHADQCTGPCLNALEPMHKLTS